MPTRKAENSELAAYEIEAFGRKGRRRVALNEHNFKASGPTWCTLSILTASIAGENLRAAATANQKVEIHCRTKHGHLGAGVAGAAQTSRELEDAQHILDCRSSLPASGSSLRSAHETYLDGS